MWRNWECSASAASSDARIVAEQRSPLRIRTQGEVGSDLGVPGDVKRRERGGVDLLPRGLSAPETPDHPKRELVGRILAEPDPVALPGHLTETQRGRLVRTDRLRSPRHRRHSLTSSAQPEQSTNDPVRTASRKSAWIATS
jgi:hypothetical protein